MVEFSVLRSEVAKHCCFELRPVERSLFVKRACKITHTHTHAYLYWRRGAQICDNAQRGIKEFSPCLTSVYMHAFMSEAPPFMDVAEG